jgi:hypothetical protein
MNEGALDLALAHVAGELRRLHRRFALIGGLGVSIRGEVRFTRDVDLAVRVRSDAEMEGLVRDLSAVGYSPLAVIEQDEQSRLATVRLRAPSGVVIDLLAASSGIEEEVVDRATEVVIEGAGAIPVARAEELLALKVLSMTEKRPQDALDAAGLVAMNPALDVEAVRELLAKIVTRGFHREQDLGAKLDAVLARSA